MFRNLRVYRLPTNWPLQRLMLEEAIKHQAFTPCGSMDRSSMGWVNPTSSGELAHGFGVGRHALCLATEVKVLVADAIERATENACAQMTEQQGFRVGRKQRKEIKESIIDEALPKAQTRITKTRAIVDTVGGWLMIDAASQARAEDVLKLLIKAIDKFPLQSWMPLQSPRAAMTEWVNCDEAPGGFTIDQAATLQGIGEGKATITYRNISLDADVQKHIIAGKQVVSLAMTWADRISFVLDQSLVLKRITPLDVLKEADKVIENDIDRFDAEYMLMAGEFGHLLADLTLALGGEQPSKVAA